MSINLIRSRSKLNRIKCSSVHYTNLTIPSGKLEIVQKLGIAVFLPFSLSLAPHPKEHLIKVWRTLVKETKQKTQWNK